MALSALLTDVEKAALLNAVDEAAYIQACLAVANARGGILPPDWFDVVMAPVTGILPIVAARLADPDFLKNGIPWPVPEGTAKPTAKHRLEVQRTPEDDVVS